MSGILGAGTDFHTEEVKPDEPFQNENTIVVIYVIFLKSGEEYSAQLNKTGHMKLRLFQKMLFYFLQEDSCFAMAWPGGAWSDVDILMEYDYICIKTTYIAHPT